MIINQLWWKLLMEKFTEKDKRDLVSTIRKTEKLLDNKEPLSLYEKYQYATLVLFELRFELAKGSKIKAIQDIFRLKKYLKDIIRSESNSEEIKLFNGLYHCVSYEAKSSFFVNPFLLNTPRSDKNLGLKLLNECSKSENIIIKSEANYFLYKIYIELYKDKINSRKYLDFLMKKYEKNEVFKKEFLKLK